MKNFGIIFLGCWIICLLLNVPKEIFAACAEATQCGCAPGQCCGMAKGGGPIYISAGTTTSNCYVKCRCDRAAPAHCKDPDNPYIQCSEAQGCYDCEQFCDLPSGGYTICSEVLWDTCCTPGCDSSRYDCSGTAPVATPIPTPPPVIAPTAPNSGGNNPDPNSGGGTPPDIGNPTSNPPPATSPVCGDGVCTGFETCANCSDCGACFLMGNAAWWQAQGGSVYAASATGYALRSLIFDNLCLAPSCVAQLISPQIASDSLSEGVAITGGGAVTGMNTINSRQQSSLGTQVTRYKETYSFFYRKSGLGQTPPDDFAGNAGDARKPDLSQPAYFHGGDMTIQSPWQVNAGETLVVFVEGNLTLSDPSGVEQLITVAEDGFLAFIASGNITLAASVGNADLTNTTPNIEGVFIADGTLRTQSQTPDKRLIGAGTFVGWTGVELGRDLGTASNANAPAELFVYRPDFVKNTPAIMKHPHTIWQETK